MLNYPELEQISADDIVKIQHICEILKPFKDCTEEMSSGQQVILLSQSLKQWCNSFKNMTSLHNEVRQMAEKLKEALDFRFKDIERHSLFAEATVLDDFPDKQCAEKAKKNLVSFCQQSKQV